MHKRGMRVILDGVFNHCGSFNKWLDRERIYEPQPEYPKGAYVTRDSPYREFFHFHDDREEAWPYTEVMTDGGDMLLCRNWRMRIHRNLSIYHGYRKEMGFSTV